MLLLINSASDDVQVLVSSLLFNTQSQTYVAFCKHEVFRENQMLVLTAKPLESSWQGRRAQPQLARGSLASYLAKKGWEARDGE